MLPPEPRRVPGDSIGVAATRLATHWIAETLAGDESFQFSVLQALLSASSDPLAGAEEATRERLALRSLQELSSLIPAGGDAAATAGVLRVDGARSCEDVLFRLATEIAVTCGLQSAWCWYIQSPTIFRKVSRWNSRRVRKHTKLDLLLASTMHIATAQVGQFIKFDEMSETSSSHGGYTSAGSIPVQELFHLHEEITLSNTSIGESNIASMSSHIVNSS